jgi:triosephosphate isomerase (TIM)
MTPPLVVGNWKMHGGPKACVELARKIASELQNLPASAEIAVAPPFIALLPVKKAIGKRPVRLAAQNCHWRDTGAFTGEVSPSMLEEIGCGFVIVGHSERRQIFCESDELIAQKLPAVIKHGMRPILCVGETIEERESMQTSAVITRQLDSALKGIPEDGIDKVEIAYEPVWAIGTGLNASAEQIRETHAQIKEFLNRRFGEAKGGQIRILYGGSVKPDNAQMIAHIDVVSGVLVGGSSLVAESFISIVRAFSSDKSL